MPGRVTNLNGAMETTLRDCDGYNTLFRHERFHVPALRTDTLYHGVDFYNSVCPEGPQAKGR